VNVLDLFSGIGGFSLGLERAGMRTVAFCEIEPYPRAVLKKHWPDIPCYDDIRTLTAERLKADGIGTIDVICGGFPCQPYSHAGKGLGAEDSRALWPEYFRLIKALRPAWVVGENVIGFKNMGLDNLLDDLESIGYATRPFDIPACALGANHERRRIWIVAHASGLRDSQFGDESPVLGEFGQRREDNEAACQQSLIADALRQRQQGQGQHSRQVSSEAHQDWEVGGIINALGWPTEPPICAANDGVPRWLAKHQLSALGNAVVPQIPEIIGRAIMAL